VKIDIRLSGGKLWPGKLASTRRKSAALLVGFAAFIVPVALAGSIALAKPASHRKPAPQTGGAKSGALQPFVLTLPGSVVKINMIPVPAGSVTIGGKKVVVKPFWIAETETTWEAHDVFMGSGPPSQPYDQTKFAPDAIARPSRSYIPPDLGWGHHGFPAINISFLNADMFCRWLAKATGKKYRLPTEAEWQYACRAGAPETAKPTAEQIDKVAWYADNSGGRTHPVGKKLPNAWKLYDMDGNAGEWAIDMAGKPVLCGGTWNDKLEQETPTERKYQTPAWQATDPQLPKSRWWLADGNFVGFRIVCEP
jgi:formylglycine-generating enzyme required for sulfatase activity